MPIREFISEQLKDGLNGFVREFLKRKLA